MSYAFGRIAVSFKVVDGLAYTEDNILIQDLCVYNLPTYVHNPQNIKEYFKQFGKVTKYQLHRKRAEYYLHFPDPKEAAIVLQKDRHIYMDCFIRVEPRDSIYQQGGLKFINQLDKALKTIPTNTNQEALILNLNDDCLDLICQKLCIEDQLNFALTCQRFHNVFVMRSKVDHAHFHTDFFRMLSLYKARIFIQILGPHIPNLEINTACGIEVCNFLGKFCDNVKKLKLNGCVQANVLHGLLKKNQLIQELEMRNVLFKDKVVKLLKNFKNLKMLYIESNYLLKGQNIHFLKGLEKLSLNGSGIEPKYFKKICKNLKNLQYLDIRDCHSLKNKECYDHITKYLSQLETIKISIFNENWNWFPQLPQLKRLEIMSFDGKEQIFIENLAKLQGIKLEELHVDSSHLTLELVSAASELRSLKVLHFTNGLVNDEQLAKISQLTKLENLSLPESSNVSNEAILELLKNCLKLRHLRLEYESLTPEFIRTVEKLLEEQRARRLRADIVHIECKCKRTIWNATLQENLPHLLKISITDFGVDYVSDSSSYEDDASFDDEDYELGYESPFDSEHHDFDDYERGYISPTDYEPYQFDDQEMGRDMAFDIYGF